MSARAKLLSIPAVLAWALLCSAGVLLCIATAWAQPAPGQPSLDPWPRDVPVSGATLRIFQPQVESWTGNQLKFRAAIGATKQGESQVAYGVVWGTASTEVDRR